LYNNIVQDKDIADIIYFAPNTAPNAIISKPYDGSQFFEDVPIEFKGEDSFDLNDINLTYHWDFGDGETSDEMNPSHAFLDPGVYTVTLTVMDDEYETGKAEIEVTILKSGPVAFILKPFKLEWNIGQKITFIGAANYIGDPSNLEYEWQFGNGNYAYGSTTKYSYAVSGGYEVTLIVRDQDGDFDEVNITLTIKAKGKPPETPPAKEPPEEPPEEPPIVPPQTGGAPPAPFTPDEDEPTTPESPPAPQKPTSTKEMNNYEWTPEDQVLTPPGGPEGTSSTAPEATIPFEITQKPARKVPLFNPNGNHIFPESDEPFLEQLIGYALEIVIGGSFIAGTFIMEVVVTGKESEGEEDSGEDEEPESEDEE
ncbi:MAG: PKD domain-containing protein, partial [Thermoplasmata archaeon]|nr:PKD domain-containing protein [Thermoplasmata archaeon]